MAYEHECLKELIEGEIYPSRFIKNLLDFNNDIIVICEDTNNFHPIDKSEYKVIKKIIAYVIQNSNDFTYSKTTMSDVYIIKRV